MAYQNGSGNAGKCPKGVLIGGEPDVDFCHSFHPGMLYALTYSYVDKLGESGMRWRDAFRMENEWRNSMEKCPYGLE